jgi:hypothetical protein
MIFTVIFIAVFLVCGYLAFKDDDHDEWRRF